MVGRRTPQELGSDNVGQGSAARAAEYVRMSTDHQKYSTENQADAIRQYAVRRGLEIVRTYADEGRSGLRLDGRDALKQLIEDVQNGKANFATILVYDVSRWGRFQDADESAYYEYICKRAGISVQYCAEQFENDGSPVSTIVKGVKRAMAGEYSRELSVKVFAGQCRLDRAWISPRRTARVRVAPQPDRPSGRREGRTRTGRAQEHPDRPRGAGRPGRRGGGYRPLDVSVVRKGGQAGRRDRECSQSSVAF